MTNGHTDFSTNSSVPIVEPLLTYRETGDLLGVTDRTIWALVNQRKLTNVRFGRSVRIDPADLRNFIEQAKGKTTSGKNMEANHVT